MAADGRGSSGRRGPPTGNTYSTTAGSQRLPGILQTVYGDKSVVGLERYGLLLGAIVPPEAVLLLAGSRSASTTTCASASRGRPWRSSRSCRNADDAMGRPPRGQAMAPAEALSLALKCT